MLILLKESVGPRERKALLSRLQACNASASIHDAPVFSASYFYLPDDSTIPADFLFRKDIAGMLRGEEFTVFETMLRQLGSGITLPPGQGRVAFQGARGAYSELALYRFFEGFTVEPVACSQFKDAFEELRSGSCDYAVLPIENALTGSIHENYDLMLDFPELTLCGEVLVRIKHHLIGVPGAELKDVKRVFSHPQGLLQTTRFLEKQKTWEQVPFYDTAGSVAHVRDLASKENAAIASSVAAEFYGMKILAEGIETNSNNYTRFIVLCRNGSKEVPLVGDIEGFKASIVFSLAHRPGALLRVLQILSERGLNLTKIESRPIHGQPWEYRFYIDFELALDFSGFSLAYEELKEVSEDLTLLGVYPKARKLVQ